MQFRPSEDMRGVMEIGCLFVLAALSEPVLENACVVLHELHASVVLHLRALRPMQIE